MPVLLPLFCSLSSYPSLLLSSHILTLSLSNIYLHLSTSCSLSTPFQPPPTCCIHTLQHDPFPRLPKKSFGLVSLSYSPTCSTRSSSALLGHFRIFSLPSAIHPVLYLVVPLATARTFRTRLSTLTIVILQSRSHASPFSTLAFNHLSPFPTITRSYQYELSPSLLLDDALKSRQ